VLPDPADSASRVPTPSRVACLRVADLPQAAARRAHPELAGLAWVVASGPGPRAEIVSVSPQAARLGVRPGTSVVHGHSTCAALVVRVASPALERAACDALLDAALSTSPRAAAAPPGRGPYAAEAAVFVDARGVARLFGSEEGFASALAARAAALGLPAVVAVAGTPAVARIAARQCSGCEETLRIVRPGGDAAFLAPLPLDLLNPDDALAEALQRFGLRRVGDLTRIPPRALATRLGRPAARLIALARGEDATPPPAAPPEHELAEGLELEAPVAQLEPLRFVLRGLLTRLAARLACRGLACGELLLELALAEGGRDARRVGVAAPTLEVPVLLRLAALALEARPPEQAVLAVRVASEGQPPRSDQLDLFRPAGPAPARLDRTLVELAALCGPDRVGAPAVADSHRPDAFALRPFAQARAGAPPPRRETAAPVLAVRALRPPLPARVRAPGGIPAWIESALARGEVVRVAGPWRTTGHWWSEEERFAFDHFDVQTADGLVVRLRFDHRERRWQIDGLYD
jgi:protein ImuB